jgi:hypothetical protein
MIHQYLPGFAHDVQDPTDIVYTPEDVARDIIQHFAPTGKCLDPCKGDGVFFRNLPAGSDYCELKDGKDFFDWRISVDWIVSNPPYSVFSEWLDHSFDIARDIVYLIPINKPFNSYAMLKRIHVWGGGKRDICDRPWKLVKVPDWFRYRCGSFPA